MKLRNPEWCIDGMNQVCNNAKMLNKKGVITRLVIVERRVLKGSLHCPRGADNGLPAQVRLDGTDSSYLYL